MAHVAEWKYKEVEKLSNLISAYPVVGIANITKVKSSIFQYIRRQLKDKALMRVAKLSLLSQALEKSKNKKLIGLADHFKDQVALILTKENPFRLHKFFEEHKIEAPAKPGDISPKEIIIPKGETSFRPGPVLTEMQHAGIKARIERGKIVVTEDSVMIKKGEKISEEKNILLEKLEIKPLTIGVSLLAAYEDGEIFTSDVLGIDQDLVLNDIVSVHTNTLNLALFMKYPAHETINILLSEAHTHARNLALQANIVTKSTIDILIQKAQGHILSLASEISKKDASLVPDHLKVEQKVKKEEKKEEAEAKEEPKKEDSDEIGGLGALFG